LTRREHRGDGDWIPPPEIEEAAGVKLSPERHGDERRHGDGGEGIRAIPPPAPHDQDEGGDEQERSEEPHLRRDRNPSAPRIAAE
jgi:hypothetical protein